MCGVSRSLLGLRGLQTFVEVRPHCQAAVCRASVVPCCSSHFWSVVRSRGGRRRAGCSDTARAGRVRFSLTRWVLAPRTTWQARRLDADFGTGKDARTAWVMARLARHPDEHGYAMAHLDDEQRACGVQAPASGSRGSRCPACSAAKVLSASRAARSWSFSQSACPR